MPWGFAAAAVGSIAGAVISGDASKSAANTQAQAAEDAAHLQNDQYNNTQANLKPYMDLGASYIDPLKNALANPMLTQQFSAPSAADAASTPGYQFTLNQGLKSVQNSAAARGLGVSGAALKGAANYTTGLADSTYNDVFNRALQTFNTNYSSAANNVNRLSNIVGSGQNAAATNGSLGAQAVGNIGNTLTSGANASAAGTIGSANALTAGLNGLGSSALTYGLMTNNAAGAGSSGAGVPGWTPSTSAGNGMSFGV
ncbi:hypothetical protein LMG28727_04863 [Paraburkholderia kirstenboschensis]|uniref:DNA transfer protein p32 n=1 Tax=Paraburkholderia kirstenboschensis TaxID=1245436 RepID=UPI000AFC902A|nr:DNA transfer protein p32 [Paraburkholderia kirstenboschensis]CAD6548616.1 hypothetical protein LMG28727_04863 [Paraburkholderia kirstenboschensis]